MDSCTLYQHVMPYPREHLIPPSSFLLPSGSRIPPSPTSASNLSDTAAAASSHLGCHIPEPQWPSSIPDCARLRPFPYSGHATCALAVNSWGHHLLLADSGVPPGCSAPPPPCCERDAKRQHTCTPSSAVGTPTHRNIPIYFLTQPPVGTLSVASQRSHRSQCGIQSSIPRRVRQEPRL